MKKLHADSLPVLAGEDLHPLNAFQPPIFQTTAFRFSTIDEMKALAQGKAAHYLYTRYTNPTLEVAEKKAAALEGGEKALVFSSGMAALTSAFFALLEKGDHVLASSSLYGGTHRLLRDILPKFGIEVEFFDVLDWTVVSGKFRSATRLLVAETPTNPALQLLPLEEVAELARRHKVPSFLDNTFATPVNQRPLEKGWDIVMHSASKYLSGHTDVTAGFLIACAEWIAQIQPYRKLFGGVLDPSAAYLLIRGMKTLNLRVARQNASALEVARFLESHPCVQKVRYPLLESHPQNALARRQMKGGGGVLSFWVAGGWEATRQFFNGLRCIPISTSLGGVESLVTSPYYTSHYGMSPQELARAEVSENLVRMAVGIEAVEDLCADLDQALRSAVPLDAAAAKGKTV